MFDPKLFKLASVVWLERKIRTIFRGRYGSNPVFLSETTELIWNSSEGPIDLVFLGDIHYILQKHRGIFPHSQGFRIWVLSSRFRSIVHELYGIPLDQIGLIPRKAFGKQNAQKGIRPEAPVDFIYAGRLIREKHLEETRSFIANFPRTGRKKNRFLIFSQDLNHKKAHEDIQKRLRHPGFTLVLRNNPRWYSEKFHNPAFISLSHALSEDFGVSSFLAQRKGWPTILSDWGGHADLTGEHCYLVKNDARTLERNTQLPTDWIEPRVISYKVFMKKVEGSPKPLSVKWSKIVLAGLRGD